MSDATPPQPAHPTKWTVHVEGPDDLLYFDTETEARKVADDSTRWFDQLPHGPLDPRMAWIVIPPVTDQTATPWTQRNWRDNAGRVLLDPNDAHGVPLTTPLDRRWLWKLEGFLAVSATTADQRAMQTDLRDYLRETCEHHWTDYPNEGPDDPIASHRSCLWCSDIEWTDQP